LHILLEYIPYNVLNMYTVDMSLKSQNNKYLKQNGHCIFLLPCRSQGDLSAVAKDFVGLVITVCDFHLNLEKQQGCEKMKQLSVCIVLLSFGSLSHNNVPCFKPSNYFNPVKQNTLISVPTHKNNNHKYASTQTVTTAQILLQIARDAK